MNELFASMPRVFGKRFTVADVEAMVAAGALDADERVELLEGELVAMSPKGNQHEVVKTALLEAGYRACPARWRMTPERTFRLSPETYLEPDIVIYRRSTGLAGLTGANVELVVEIADSCATIPAARPNSTPASACANSGLSTP